MFLMMSPAMATAIARKETVDEVRESRHLRAARITPEPDDAKGRHRAPRRSRALWIVHPRNRLAH